MRPAGLLRALAAAVLLSAAATAAQPAPRAPADPSPVIERFADDPDHTYGHALQERPSWWDLFWDWVRDNIIAPMMSDKARFFWRYIAPVLAVLGIAWALYRLFGGEGGGLFTRRDKTSPAGDAGPMLDVEDISTVDLDALLAAAMAEGRLRDVVRYRFLRALQALAAAGAVEWGKWKTNRQYASELRGSAPAVAVAFEQASRVFAWVWYGDHPLDAPAAAAADTALERLEGVLPAAPEPAAMR